ncbi:MAG: hippurate hydrolase [Xanthobacteraceae bacterium]|nr:MAG: hippurate hydrolase [Xanthobacteraceae bacterium]
MPIVNRISALHEEVTAWRRDFHENPELMFDVHRTAGIVAEKLKEFGCDEVVPGIGKTGVVGIIKGRNTGSGKVVGLRADMDALPLTEITGLPHASKVPGKMHACGHDGHTAMLLGAAKYLAETRNFDGTVAVIFQPAEEGGGGGREMVNDGMMDRFGIQEVYGMHNAPGLPVGKFALRPGPLMAAADRIQIDVEGKGGHAAKPHLAVDTILIATQIVNNVQSIVSRNVDPLGNAVVSICAFNAGFTDNVIPQTATLLGTVRTLTPEMRDLVEKRLHQIVEGTAAMYGGTAKLTYHRDYPVTKNHADNAIFAGDAAAARPGRHRIGAPPGL